MEIPMMNLGRLHNTMQLGIDEAIKRVLQKSSFILGEEVESFEKEFASWLGTKHAIGVGSCTDAIILSLLALGIGEGDEVITTSLSAFPTSEAILRTGAKSVYVDIDPATFNIDVAKIEEAISGKTKAILPVHLYGLPADLDKIMEIAGRHNLPVVEDCAQSTGARWHGKLVGTFGRAACFSFFPSKNLGAMGDGGLIATNDDALAARVRALRAHGEEGGRFLHRYVGYNSRLSGLQAAILRVKLEHLEKHNKERQDVASFYHKELASSGFLLPNVPDGYAGEHVYHLYVIRIPEASGREPLIKYLGEHGVKTQVHYPRPLHHQPAHKVEQTLPAVELAVNQVISIPLFPTMTKEESRYVADTLKAWKS